MSIKVPELSLGALWAGPPIARYEKTWAQQNDVAQLAVRLAQRRLPLKQAQAEIETFAKSAGDDRESKLLALVAGLFDTLNSERSSVIAGLDRFGARQKELADQIRTQLDALHTMQGATDQDTARITALGEQLQWETRLFEERRETTQYACAVPDLIEQRFFALAHTIQQNLSNG